MEAIIRNQAELETINTVDFKNKTSISLNLESLSNSATNFMATGGLPASRPVHHYQFIQWLRDVIQDNTRQEVEIEPIHASLRHTKRIRFSADEIINIKEPCPIDRLNIERVVTKLNVKGYAHEVNQDVINYSVAVSYTEKGIMIATGANVFHCSNMNIFGENIFATYGSNKFSFEDLKRVITTDALQFASKLDEDHRTISKLASTYLSPEKEAEIVHEIFNLAVNQNLKRKGNNILNLSQTVKMQEELIKKRDEKETLTYWDLMQSGTEHLKGDRQDILNLIPTIKTFNHFVLNK